MRAGAAEGAGKMTEAQASRVAGRPVTQEDIWLMHRVGNPAASPDGRWLAVAVIEPDRKSTRLNSSHT